LFVQDRTVSEALGISVLVSPGPRLIIDATGRKLPGEKHLREVMGLRAGDRYSDNALTDASSRLESWYGDRGYRGAAVDVRVHSSTSETTKVTVDARPGRKHWLRETNYPDEMPIPEREARAVVQEATDGSLAERIVSQKGIDRASKALKERFRSEGFLDAQVSIEEIKGRFSGVMSVTRWGVPVTLDVKVEPGSRVSLGSLRVRGGTGLADEVVAAWKAEHVDRPFRSGSVAELESAILSKYEKNGHLDVRTRVSTVRERARGTASVDILVEPGEALQLRSVVVRGNRRTRRQVIQREVMLKSGDAIAPGAISATRTNLYNLDLFRQVSPELVGDEPNSRDLVLTVAERANILLEAGGGVSTDQGIAATGRATHRNIAGRGHRLTGLGSVGYGWDGDEWLLNTATPVWRAAARYEIPYVPGRGGRLVSEALFNEAVQEPAWRLSRTGGSLGMKMRLSDRAEAVVDYRVQVRRLVDVDPGALVNGDPWVPYLGLADDLSGDPVLTSDARVVSGGGLMVVHDQRDDRFNPRKGGLWSTHVEFGDGAFTGNVTMRASGKIERLIPVGPVVVDLVGRAGVGFAQGRTVTLPLEERFFLGGGSSLRGFATDSVGPANFAMRPEIDHPSQSEPLVDGLALPREPGHWVATGGDAMFSGTVELRVPLSVIGVNSDSASLVLFSDAGKVAFLDPTVVTTSTIEGQDPWARFSFGTGLRIATPVGPASFDVGINPNPIADRDEAWILPHLSLGVL
jgi:outer membrane protein insertion porin family